MVQIIPLSSGFLTTNPIYFISHMVQIIRIEEKEAFIFDVFFISHMVQIIHRFKCLFAKRISLLYIPHGSDNTLGDPPKYDVYKKLYIPHGSDNT